MSSLATVAGAVAVGLLLIGLGNVNASLEKIAVALDDLRTIERHRYAREVRMFDETEADR